MAILGVGVDLEAVERFRAKPVATSERFYKRIFSEAELAYCLARADPYPHLTARFCAKEACVKALSKWGRVWIREIEVEKAQDGRPLLRLVSERDEVRALSGERTLEVSMSHTEKDAMAMVVAS